MDSATGRMWVKGLDTVRHLFCRGESSIELSSNLVKRKSGKTSLFTL